MITNPVQNPESNSTWKDSGTGKAQLIALNAVVPRQQHNTCLDI